MVLKLISATPSPYARKVRIALLEKGIPFELQTEVPWDSTTATPKHNPLEKLPVLITEAGTSIYESSFILEWLEAHYAPPQYPAMFPQVQERALFAKQVQVVADGICDALVLLFWEMQREPEKQSPEWMARQRRKVDGGIKALAGWVGEKKFIVNERLSVADIAVGSVLGYMKVRFAEHGWEGKYPALKRYTERLEERESFRKTVPTPQKAKDKIV